MILPLLVVLVGGGSREAPRRPAENTVSVARLPARVAGDFRRLATRTPLLVFGAGAAASTAAHAADQPLAQRIGASERNSRVYDTGAEVGDGVVQWGAAAAIYAIGLAARRPPLRALGSALLESQVVEGAIAQGLKHTVRRARPDGGRYSFPSGHASATFATADIVLQQFGWKAGLPAYAGAVFVGLSRVEQREHYLSDVVAGATIGIASARGVRVRARGGRIVASPAALRGGGMIFVSVCGS
jgi:membrane-associated phospholipid phosphatase